MLCITCQRNISPNPKVATLKCMICADWHHATCTGLDLDRTNYYVEEAKKELGDRWTCAKCATEDVPGNLSSDLSHSFSINNSPPTLIEIQKMFERVIDNRLSIFNSNIQKSINDLSSAIETISTKLAKLDAENAQLRTELSHLKNKESTYLNDSSAANIINEINEQTIRANNLIMYNVNESLSKNIETRIKDDTVAVYNFFSKDEHITSNIKKIIRIGKLSSTKTRPIKIIFNNNNIPKTILTSFDKYKDNNPNVKVKSDLTELQRNYLNKLYRELNERKNNGENNLSIKYIRNIPQIVTLNETIIKNKQKDDSVAKNF